MTSTAPTLAQHTIVGTGDTTLFLLHGAYGDSRYFAPTMERLAAAGLRVVAWDCPGYAGTLLPEGYSIELLAEYATHLVRSLGTERNVLLGHSMGALIGPRAAALLGTELDLLILSSASAGFASRTEEDKARYLAERVAPIKQEGMTVREYAPRLLKSMMAPTSRGPLVDLVVETVSTMSTEAFVASMAAITAYDSRPSLRALSIPTLLLAGEHDTACPPAGMRAMTGLVERSEFRELPGCGHYAFAEVPDLFIEAVMAFVTHHLDLQPQVQ